MKRHQSVKSAVRRCRARERGGVYIMVLGVASMLAVVGMGVIAVSRTAIASSVASRQWSNAGVLAQASLEAGLCEVNTSPTWRAAFDVAPESTRVSMNGGETRFRVEDPADGVLGNGVRDEIRITGIGASGPAARAYSVQARYVPPPVLPVLRYAVYSPLALRCLGTKTTIVGARIGCGAALTNDDGNISGGISTAVLTGDVDTLTLVNPGTIVGEVRQGRAPLQTSTGAGPGAWATQATLINYNSLSNKIEKELLSSGRNPYGAPNAAGIYLIRVTAGKELRIADSRVLATLVVDLTAANAKLKLEKSVLWESPATSQPTLVVLMGASSVVTFNMDRADLRESDTSLNLNPASTPYNGVSDADTSDRYPSVVRGIIHIVGAGGSAIVKKDTIIVGTLICEAALTLDTSEPITYDPLVLNNPPVEYQTGPASMQPVLGSFAWVPVP